MLAAEAVREQLADALLGIEAAREAAGDAEDGGGDSALVIDGRALAHALGPDMRQTLLAVRAAGPQKRAGLIRWRSGIGLMPRSVALGQSALVTASVSSTAQPCWASGFPHPC